MPGRISRISILLEDWDLLLGARLKSVHPDMQVCAEGVCFDGNISISAIGGATMSL